MYRIEVSPGEETVFRTIEELATGIRNGVITSRSRIHHGASDKWLPIEFHPHYKKAVELAAHPPSATEQAQAAPAAPAAKPVAKPAPASRPIPTPLPWERPSPVGAEPLPFVEPPPPPPPEKPAEPVLSLPKISYPEVPAEEPRTEQPLFRKRRKLGRGPVFVTAAIVVAVGARFMLAAAPPTGEPELPTAVLGSNPSPVVAPAPAPRAKPEPSAPEAPPPSQTSPIPQPAPLPRRVEPATPTVPGPAFAPALPARAAPAVRASARVPAPAKVVAAPADSAPVPAIEPAPAQLDLSLPSGLPSTDSISVTKSADSNAMRRILKAVTGSKAQPTKATAP